MLSRIVSDDVIRAQWAPVRRQHNPEEFYLMFFGKAFELDQLAVPTFPGRPVERVHTPIGGSRAGIIHLTIVLEWAIVDFVHLLNGEHDVFGGIPAIHEDSV